MGPEPGENNQVITWNNTAVKEHFKWFLPGKMIHVKYNLAFIKYKLRRVF